MHVTLIYFHLPHDPVGLSRGLAKACHIARFILSFPTKIKNLARPQASPEKISRETAIVSRQIDAERIRLINVTKMQATLLPVFGQKSKAHNVLRRFKIRRKSFAMTCHN